MACGRHGAYRLGLRARPAQTMLGSKVPWGCEAGRGLRRLQTPHTWLERPALLLSKPVAVACGVVEPACWVVANPAWVTGEYRFAELEIEVLVLGRQVLGLTPLNKPRVASGQLTPEKPNTWPGWEDPGSTDAQPRARVACPPSSRPAHC